MGSWLHNGTLAAGTAQTFDIFDRTGFRPQSIAISNDDANNEMSVTINGTTTLIPALDSFTLTGAGYGDVISLLSAAGGDFRMAASSNPYIPVAFNRHEINTLNATLDGVTIDTNGGGQVELKDGAISNARIDKIADDAFTAAEFVAGAGGKFATNCLDTTAILNAVADAAFTMATFAPGAGGKFAAGALNQTNADNLLAAKAISASKLVDGTAVAGIDSSDVRFLANGASHGVVPVVYAINQPADAAGNIDLVITSKVLVLDAWLEQEAVGNVADTVQLFNNGGANAITDALNFTAGAAGDVTRAAQIHWTNRTVAAGTFIRATFTDGSAGAGDLKGTVYILACPIA